MDTIKKCTGHDCWTCRHNIEGKPNYVQKDVCNAKFMRMCNIADARRLYEEKRYYDPTSFRWKNVKDLKTNLSEFIGHRVILLGKYGDIRPGTLIAPHSAPTECVCLDEDSFWIRGRFNPESVLVYAMQSTVGFIDLESYSDKYSHSFRVTEHHGRFSLKIEDLPF